MQQPQDPKRDTFDRTPTPYAGGVPPRPPRAGSVSLPQSGLQGDHGPAKPFLQVWFKCAGQYRRVYKNRDGSSYDAVCPICAKSCAFRVGAEGTSRRMFEVSC